MSLLGFLTGVLRGFGLLSLGVLGLAAFGASLRTMRQVVHLARSPTTRMVGLEPGSVTVVGDAAAEEPLVAPVSGESCVGYVLREWTSHVPEGGLNDAATSLSGLEWWEDDSTRERAGAAVRPFRLCDGGGEVVVDPRPSDERGDGDVGRLDPLSNFDLTDPPRETVEFGEGPLPDRLARAVERHTDLGRADAVRRRYVEERVPASGLAVTGQAVRDGGRVTVVNGTGTFVLSDTGLSATIRDRVAVTAVLVAVGFVALAAAAYGLRAWFGVAVGP